MMLDSPMLDSYRYECTLLEHVRVPDGQGGSQMAWTDGMKFDMIRILVPMKRPAQPATDSAEGK